MTNSERITSHNALIDEAIAKANALPDAGSGGGVEYEIITIPAGATSATYTLPRVTAAYGGAEWSFDANMSDTPILINIYGTFTNIITDIVRSDYAEFSSNEIMYNNGTITWYDGNIVNDIVLCLINDPNAEAIST